MAAAVVSLGRRLTASEAGRRRRRRTAMPLSVHLYHLNRISVGDAFLFAANRVL